MGRCFFRPHGGENHHIWVRFPKQPLRKFGTLAKIATACETKTSVEFSPDEAGRSAIWATCETSRIYPVRLPRGGYACIPRGLSTSGGVRILERPPPPPSRSAPPLSGVDSRPMVFRQGE